MIKSLLSLAILLCCFPTMSQNLSVIVRRDCAPDNAKEINEMTSSINEVMRSMVDEGKLINAGVKMGLPSYRQIFVLQSESDFQNIYQDFEKQISKSKPEAYKSFQQICPRSKDTTIHKVKLYPAIKSDIDSYAEPVSSVDEVLDPSMNYNVVFDFTATPLVEDSNQIDSVAINYGLADVGRILNLHRAAGIPQNKINFVLAIHGWGIYSFLSNEEHQKKYKVDNPNLRLIEELHRAGVQFLICGQVMNRLKLDKTKIIPQAKVSFSAKTTITHHQLMGYAFMAIND